MCHCYVVRISLRDVRNRFFYFCSVSVRFFKKLVFPQDLNPAVISSATDRLSKQPATNIQQSIIMFDLHEVADGENDEKRDDDDDGDDADDCQSIHDLQSLYSKSPATTRLSIKLCCKTYSVHYKMFTTSRLICVERS